MDLWRCASSCRKHVILFTLDSEILFICMSTDFALTREEIGPVKMRENKEYLSCSRHKKDYITPCASKQMSLLLEQLA